MILDFGYICMEMRTKINCALDTCETHITSQQNTITPGGSATLHAIAAARCGAQVSLSGAIGDDLFAKTILNTLRKEGVRATSIANAECPTDITTHIIAPDKPLTISNTQSNTIASEKQIAEHSLSPRTFIIIHDDFAPEQNLPLLERGKERQSLTAMSIKHCRNITQDILEHLDIIFINSEVIKDLAQRLNMPEKTLPRHLAETYNLNCIIVKNHGLDGTLICTKELEEIKQPPLTNSNTQDISASYEAFCGSFIACTQAAKSIKTALAYAQSAAALTAQKDGSYTSLPYLAEIEVYIEKHL